MTSGRELLTKYTGFSKAFLRKATTQGMTIGTLQDHFTLSG
jgi:hypothetical protein